MILLKCMTLYFFHSPFWSNVSVFEVCNYLMKIIMRIIRQSFIETFLLKSLFNISYEFCGADGYLLVVPIDRLDFAKVESFTRMIKSFYICNSKKKLLQYFEINMHYQVSAPFSKFLSDFSITFKAIFLPVLGEVFFFWSDLILRILLYSC